MRTLAIVACALLFATAALAQDRGKGGPTMDPLGDRKHAEPEPKAAAPVRVKSKVERRTVRKTRTVAPAPKRVTAPDKPKRVPPQKQKQTQKRAQSAPRAR